MLGKGSVDGWRDASPFLLLPTSHISSRSSPCSTVSSQQFSSRRQNESPQNQSSSALCCSTPRILRSLRLKAELWGGLQDPCHLVTSRCPFSSILTPPPPSLYSRAPPWTTGQLRFLSMWEQVILKFLIEKQWSLEQISGRYEVN